MAKNLYSVILSEELVSLVDELAKKNNTSRSNQINNILANYFSYTTMDMQIDSILGFINNMLSKNDEFQFLENNCDRQLSVKTSLDYKYNPSLKYSIELYKNLVNDSIGDLKIIYRISSPELRVKLERYFNYIISFESSVNPTLVKTSMYEQKFIRQFYIEQDLNFTYDEIAESITEYVNNIDRTLKKYLNDKYTTLDEFCYDYLSVYKNLPIVKGGLYD